MIFFAALPVVVKTADTHLTFTELVHLLVDVVSKNGNLLLGISPMADGTIPPLQQQRLEELGSWLKINGESIFNTRPWVTAEATTREAVSVRFREGVKAVYVILLNDLPKRKINIEHLQVTENSIIHLLGCDEVLFWGQNENIPTVNLPEVLQPAPASALRITPSPTWARLD